MELRMTQKERDKMKVIGPLSQGLLGTAQGARMLGLTQRQIQRLLKGYRQRGDRALVHGLRGRRSHNAIAAEVRADAEELLRTQYADFGPTLAAEHLRDDDGIAASRETVRGWMMELRLWGGQRKKHPHRQRRPRRACFGELVQMDTSAHDWLEGRGPQCVLITMIDDATGRKLMQFFQADTTATNMTLIRRWIQRHGRPLALYTDWAGHFKQAQRAGQKAVQTQIQRALSELDIRLIAAHSPQAKGRVERSHGTDQDRLVKELRLAGIASLEAANGFLERVYLPRVNEKFAVEAASPVDAHREAAPFDLEAIFSVQEPRRVQNDYTVQVDGVAWQIERGQITGGLRQSRVIVEWRLDGSMRLRWGDRYLRHHRAPTACRIAPQSAPENQKTEAAKQGAKPATAAGVGVAAFREGSIRTPSLHCATPTPAIPKPQYKPAPDHPWR
jgi:hypothetical protein